MSERKKDREEWGGCETEIRAADMVQIIGGGCFPIGPLIRNSGKVVEFTIDEEVRNLESENEVLKEEGCCKKPLL